MMSVFYYFSASGNSLEYYGHSNHLVYENGMIIWVPPTLFHVFCEINLRNWPFDVQECYLRIGSWTYSGEMVDLQIKDTDDEVRLTIKKRILFFKKKLLKFKVHGIPDFFMHTQK